MPTIEFSPVAIASMAYSSAIAQVYTDINGCGFFGTVNSLSNQKQQLRIMQGSMPSDFSNLTNGNTSKSSDILLTFNRYDGYTSDEYIISPSATSVAGGATMSMSTHQVTAAMSGTATWFWMLNYIISSGTIMNQMFGSVSATGDGGDLEMTDINIVSGNTYMVTRLKLFYPSTIVYT